MILLDTNFLYAINDADDSNYDAAIDLLPKLQAPQFIVTPVLAELCYLMRTRLGHQPMRRFVRELNTSDIAIMPLEKDDLGRIAILLEQYASIRLDFADAAIVALAERYNIRTIATFDRRDFSIIRPQHTAYFELLP